MRPLLIVPVVALVACAPMVPARQFYDGPAPTNPEGRIKAWMGTNLKDPDSVKGYAYEGMSRTETGYYRASVVFNAKNSYGAYTGVQRHYFIFKGDEINIHVSEAELNRLNSR